MTLFFFRELFRGLDQDKDNNVTVDEIENSDIIIWKEFARATNKEGHGPTKYTEYRLIGIHSQKSHHLYISTL